MDQQQDGYFEAPAGKRRGMERKSTKTSKQQYDHCSRGGWNDASDDEYYAEILGNMCTKQYQLPSIPSNQASKVGFQLEWSAISISYQAPTKQASKTSLKWIY